MGEEEGAFGQDEADALTLPRHRLLQRLVGIAKKLGVQADVRLLRECDETSVKRWLEWQRKKRETLLTPALLQVLIDHYGLNPAEAGRKLATKAEPAPPPEPKPRRQEPPPPPASHPSPSQPPPTVNGAPPPPPASPSSSRPPPAVNGRASAGAGVRTMSAAIREPETRPPPRKPYVCSPAEMKASVDRLNARLMKAHVV